MIYGLSVCTSGPLGQITSLAQELSDPMIQITKSGTVCSGAKEDLARMRARFEKQHCILLPGLLEPGLLNFIQHQLDQAEFDESVEPTGSVLLRMKNNLGELSLAVHALSLVVNNSEFFEIIREITGCDHIGSFDGSVYRLAPDIHHSGVWHDDEIDYRMIAMSINLSTDIFGGGILQIRNSESKQIVYEVANTGFGDGIIFRIGSHLEHHVTNVEGVFAKTAFAGWFKSQPEHLSELKKICHPI